MAGRPYTTKEVAYMREHWGSKSSQQIADDIGRTKSGVLIAAQRYNLVHTKKPYRQTANIDIKELGMLIAQGRSAQDAANELGVTKQTIAKRIKTMPEWYQDKAFRNGENNRKRAIRAAYG